MRSKPALCLKRLRYHMPLKQSVLRPLKPSNLIVIHMSKSLPVYVNNSADYLTMSHICPLRRKKNLEPCGSFNMCISLFSTANRRRKEEEKGRGIGLFSRGIGVFSLSPSPSPSLRLPRSLTPSQPFDCEICRIC